MNYEDDYYLTKHTLKNGKQLIIKFENSLLYFDSPENRIWEVGFMISDGVKTYEGITNDGNPFEIFPLVFKDLQKVVEASGVRYVSSTFVKERLSVYRKLFRKYFKGWTQYHFQNEDGYTCLMVTKDGDLPHSKTDDGVDVIGLGGNGPAIVLSTPPVLFGISTPEAEKIINVLASK